MQQERNLQDQFLNLARKQKEPVTVILTNGFQMRAKICGFDNFVIMLSVDGKQQMVYKHAVSTIVPQRTLVFERTQEESN